MKHHCMNANLMRFLDELRGPVMAQLPWTRTEGGNMPEEPSPPPHKRSCPRRLSAGACCYCCVSGVLEHEAFFQYVSQTLNQLQPGRLFACSHIGINIVIFFEFLHVLCRNC